MGAIPIPDHFAVAVLCACHKAGIRSSNSSWPRSQAVSIKSEYTHELITGRTSKSTGLSHNIFSVCGLEPKIVHNVSVATTLPTGPGARAGDMERVAGGFA
eukprot:4758953-Amphidinium_carterae.1